MGGATKVVAQAFEKVSLLNALARTHVDSPSSITRLRVPAGLVMPGIVVLRFPSGRARDARPYPKAPKGERSHERQDSQFPANLAAPHAYQPGIGGHARHLGRAQCAGGGFLRSVPEDQELPLACLGSALPRLPPAARRASRPALRDDRSHRRAGSQARRNHAALDRPYRPPAESRGQRRRVRHAARHAGGAARGQRAAGRPHARNARRVRRARRRRDSQPAGGLDRRGRAAGLVPVRSKPSGRNARALDAVRPLAPSAMASPSSSFDAASAESSPWSPLRNALFRNLWIATIVSNVGSWMQDVGSGWLMTSLSSSPSMVALVEAADSIPMMLLALPAGALADIIDRRRLLIAAQVYLLVIAGTLALLTWLGMMTAWALLGFTCALGVGAAVIMPAWSAVLPDLVPNEELASAVALNSIAINVSRAVGPAIAGVLVAAVGPWLVFVLNALSYIGILFV